MSVGGLPSLPLLLDFSSSLPLTCPMTIGPAPRIMIDLMSVRFLMAPPVVQASKGAATAGMAEEVGDDDEGLGGGEFIGNFIFRGGGDEGRRPGLSAPPEAEAMAATAERPRPAVRAAAEAARGWRAAISCRGEERGKRKERKKAG